MSAALSVTCDLGVSLQAAIPDITPGSEGLISPDRGQWRTPRASVPPIVPI
jgi:hypothetical protein